MRSIGAWMIEEIITVWAREDNFTAVLQLSDASKTPDICSASDLCQSFQVFFIYLSSSPVYLLLLRLSCSLVGQISLVGAAAFPFVLNTFKTP